MSQFSFDAVDELATQRLGAALAELLPDGTVVALSGTLGAGKTRLVQAVAASCGIDPREVNSPTFVLCQSYRGSRTIHHFDVYRLKDSDEFLQLGPEEYFESAALSFVEWADKFPELLPEFSLEARIEVVGPTQRRFILSARHPVLAPLIEQIAARLFSV